MQFLGSLPVRTIDGVRLKIRNRPATWVIVPVRNVDTIRFFEFYLDFANNVIRKSKFGATAVVERPYIIERQRNGGIERTVYPYLK